MNVTQSLTSRYLIFIIKLQNRLQPQPLLWTLPFTTLFKTNPGSLPLRKMLPLCPVNCACFVIVVVSTASKQFKGPEKGDNLFALHHYFHTTRPLPTLTVSSFESPVVWLCIPYYSSTLSSASLKDHFTHYSIISTSYTTHWTNLATGDRYQKRRKLRTCSLWKGDPQTQ